MEFYMINLIRLFIVDHGKMVNLMDLVLFTLLLVKKWAYLLTTKICHYVFMKNTKDNFLQIIQMALEHSSIKMVTNFQAAFKMV